MKNWTGFATAGGVVDARVRRSRWRLVASTMLGAQIPLSGAAIIGGLMLAPAVAQAQVSSLILEGDYIKVGINGSKGTLGYDGTTSPGILYDGTGTGTFNTAYDYLTPGTPFEGFVVYVNGTTLVNNNAGNTSITAISLTDYSGIEYAGTTYDNRAIWEGSYGSLFRITNDYYFNDDSQQVSISTTITALTDLTGLEFSRAVDPDAVAASGDSSSTNNYRGTDTVASSDLVYAEALVSKYVIGLYTDSTYEHNSAVTGWTKDTDSYLAGTNAGNGDNTIGLGFSIGDLATGESAVINYAYIFGTDIAAAVEDSGAGSGEVKTNIIGDSAASDVAEGVYNLVMSGGTIIFASDLTLATALTIDSAGGSVDTGTNNAVMTGAIDGVGGLTKKGAGTLTLTGTNSYTGGTTVLEGTLAGDTTSLQGDIANNATVEFAQASDGSYTGKMSGTGTLVKTGTGTLTLTGANSYTGGTTVEAGTLVGNATSLQGNIVNNATVEFAQATSGSYAGSISGTGTLVKSGSGSLSLTGANSYTGGTTVLAGTLIGSTTSLQGDIVNNATVEFVQGTDGSYTGVMSGTGTLVKAGNGTLTLTGANSYTGGTTVRSGTLVGDTTSLQGDIVNSGTVEFAQAGDGTYTGAVSDSGALVKSGEGNLTLTGANSYTGGTTVLAGTLTGDTTSLQGDIVNNATVAFVQPADGTYTGVVSGTGTLVKAGNGTLTLTGANSYTGGTTVRSGTLVGNTTSLQGDIANNATVEFAQASDGAYTGVVSGSGTLVKTGEGTLTLTGANSYTGGTTVLDGMLVGDTTSLQGNIANDAVVAFAQDTDGSYAGTMSGTGTLAKIGSGTVTLTGANSYTGGTLVMAGTLVGDTTSLQGDIANSATVEFAQGSDGSYTGTMSGTGTLVKTGEGTLTLTGANSYTGGTTVLEGTLAGDTTSLQGDIANSATVEFAQGSEGSYTGVMSGTGTLVKTGEGTLTLTGANSYTGGTTVLAGTLVGNTTSLHGDIANNATVEFAQDSTASYAGVISGTGSLVKSGTGALTLTGANSYTGGTTVLEGRLIGTTDTLTGDIVNDAEVEFAQVDDGTYTGTLSGTGTLLKSGAGTLTLAGTAEGLTLDLSAGSVIAASQASIGTSGGAILIRNGTSFEAGANLDITQSVVMGSGGGAIDTGDYTVRLSGGSIGSDCLTKTGSGTLILDSAASNDIGACVQQGTMAFDSVFTGNVYVDAGATASGGGTIVGNVQVSGTLSPGNSPGQLVVEGSVTQLAGSTLAIDLDGTTAGTGAGHFDTLVLTGATSVYTADGTLKVSLRGITGSATNSFTPSIGQTFQIVTAEGGVTGSYDGLAQPTSGLADNTRLDVIYGTNTVVLAVTPDSYAAYLAGTGTGTGGSNATSVAGALDSIRPDAGVRTTGTVGTLFNSLATLGSDQLATTMQQLAGGIHSDAIESQLQANQAVRETMVQRIQARGTVTGANQPKNGLWGAFTAQRVDVDGDWSGDGYRGTTYGYTIGADRQATKNLVVGVAATYKDVKTTTSDIGKSTVNSYGGSLYAVWNKGSSYVSGVFDVNVDDYKIRRNVVLGDGVDALKGDIDGLSYGADIEAGHRFELGAVGVTPVAGIAYDRVERDAFDETGGTSTALSFDADGRNAWTARAGVRVDGTTMAGTTLIRPYVSAMVVEQLGAARTMLTANLADAAFNTRSVSAGRTQLRAETGLTANLSRSISFDLRYRYTGLGNADAHSGNAAISLHW